MASEDESKSMLKAQQPCPVSELEIDEASIAIAIAVEPQRRNICHDENKPTIRSLYANANLCASIRCLFSLPMLGSAAYILSRGASPTFSPFAAYSLACACIHVLLAAHRAVRPRSSTSALPPWLYMLALVASPAALLAAFAVGLAVIASTTEFFGQRDTTKLADCGRRTGPSKICHPKTPEADAFDFTILCVSFAFAALMCSLLQCYAMWRLGRSRYTEKEIEYACNLVGKGTFVSIMRDEFVDWYRRVLK